MEAILRAYLIEREHVPENRLANLPIGRVLDACALKYRAIEDSRERDLACLREAKHVCLQVLQSMMEPLPPPVLNSREDSSAVQSLYEQAVSERQAEGFCIPQSADTPPTRPPGVPSSPPRPADTYESMFVTRTRVHATEPGRPPAPLPPPSVPHVDHPHTVLLSSHDRDVRLDAHPFDFSIKYGSVTGGELKYTVCGNAPVDANTIGFYFDGVANTRGFTFKSRVYPPYDGAAPSVPCDTHAVHQYGHRLPAAYNLREVVVRTAAGFSPPPFLLATVTLSASSPFTVVLQAGALPSTYVPMCRSQVVLDPPCRVSLRCLNTRLPVNAAAIIANPGPTCVQIPYSSAVMLQELLVMHGSGGPDDPCKDLASVHDFLACNRVPLPCFTKALDCIPPSKVMFVALDADTEVVLTLDLTQGACS